MSAISTKVYTVSEITQAIKQHLEPRFFHICLKGEITNFKKQSSGHLYFNLKDDHSQISCVLFRGNAVKLDKEPKAGDMVMIKGSISVYAPRGSYQVIAQELVYEGVGDLLLMLHELKKKYHQKGYFEPSAKKPLPKYPKTIGVITSPTGAVIQDILHVLKRRFKGFQLILNPVKVQGEGADVEIAKAIDDFNRFKLVDVMIVGRGGGSLEDLFAFNKECVIEAIFKSDIPIIAAIGHETDVSLADFVADVRAPTPSSAAELAVKEKSQQQEFLLNADQHCLNSLRQLLKQCKLKMRAITTQRVFTTPDALLGPYSQALDDITLKIDELAGKQTEIRALHLAGYAKQLAAFMPGRQLQSHRENLRRYAEWLSENVQKQIAYRKERLIALEKLISSLSPTNILKKGYCIPFAENTSSVIISAKQLHENDPITLQFHDGKVGTIVKKGT
ncbi:MAG: Exodeoxyribonuclease 7 large subunit [Chlamydiia bacterium]|nr:Exodeoxyribonuclease 7 large subunit [Chlamydiia bacterium]